jgi:hypothetical protein
MICLLRFSAALRTAGLTRFMKSALLFAMLSAFSSLELVQMRSLKPGATGRGIPRPVAPDKEIAIAQDFWAIK